MPEEQLDLPYAVELFADEMSEIEQGEMPEEQLDLPYAVELFADEESNIDKMPEMVLCEQESVINQGLLVEDMMTREN